MFTGKALPYGLALGLALYVGMPSAARAQHPLSDRTKQTQNRISKQLQETLTTISVIWGRGPSDPIIVDGRRVLISQLSSLDQAATCAVQNRCDKFTYAIADDREVTFDRCRLSLRFAIDQEDVLVLSDEEAASLKDEFAKQGTPFFNGPPDPAFLARKM